MWKNHHKCGRTRGTTGRRCEKNGIPLNKILQVYAWQDDQEVPLQLQYDKAIWSGLSWAAVEIRKEDLNKKAPLILKATTTEEKAGILKGELYRVRYDS